METALWVLAVEVGLLLLSILGVAGAVAWALKALSQPETFQLRRTKTFQPSRCHSRERSAPTR
jgi:hypothetical protein